MGEKWMFWAFLEACARTVSKLLSKLVGVVSKTLPDTIFATFVIGAVQTLAGLIVAKATRKSFLAGWKNTFGACLFGFIATLLTILGFIVFLEGGDVGINTFIVSLGIVPGALIDRFIFHHKLVFRQWVGIIVAIFAGYTILGWPSLTKLFSLPAWVGLSFLMMLGVTANQGITQAISKIDPFVKNFWGGLTTLIFSFAGLLIFGSLNLLVDFQPMKNLWLVSIMTGFAVIGIWSFNLLSYKGGASIAIKKLVMNGSYLSMAMVGGIIVFGEPVVLSKAVGVMFYLLAFSLMDEGTWNLLARRIK